MAKTTTQVSIDKLKQGRITLRLIGNTPLYMNSMSVKARRDLATGAGKKTAAQKKEMKHNPEEEFRASAYRRDDGETLLCFPAPGIKSAMATAALETGGVTKSSVNRLIFLPQQHVPIWGTPYLKMDIVRSADINRTPDVRTRAYIPRWCSEVDIAFIQPTLSSQSIISLLSNAGVVVGIGDFRQEKGRGSFGTFSVAASDMGEWQEQWDEITAMSRSVQEDAMMAAEPWDQETRELLTYVQEERERRTV